MRKLNIVLAELRKAIEKRNLLAGVLEDFKTSQTDVQIAFGRQTCDGFEIKFPELILMPFNNSKLDELYEKAKKFYQEHYKLELHRTLSLIENLQEEETEILKQLVKKEDNHSVVTCSYEPCN